MFIVNIFYLQVDISLSGYTLAYSTYEGGSLNGSDAAVKVDRTEHNELRGSPCEPEGCVSLCRGKWSTATGSRLVRPTTLLLSTAIEGTFSASSSITERLVMSTAEFVVVSECLRLKNTPDASLRER